MPLIHQLRDRLLPMSMDEWQLLGRIVEAGDEGYTFVLFDGLLILGSLHLRGLIEALEDGTWQYVATAAGKSRWMNAEGDPVANAWKLRNRGMLDA